MYVRMCICCLCRYVYTYMYVRMYVPICVCMYVHICVHIYVHICDWIYKKPTKLSQEMKSELKPNINDTLMHCPEASTMWL